MIVKVTFDAISIRSINNCTRQYKVTKVREYNAKYGISFTWSFRSQFDLGIRTSGTKTYQLRLLLYSVIILYIYLILDI